MNCAHAIVELLDTYWPSTIDMLEREKAIVDGCKPIFLSDRTPGSFEDFFSSESEYVCAVSPIAFYLVSHTLSIAIVQMS